MSIAPVLVSITDAAAALGIGTTKTKQLIASGELRSVTVDRRRLVPVVALSEYVDRLEGHQRDPEPQIGWCPIPPIESTDHAQR